MYEDKLLILKKRGIFKNIYHKRLTSNNHSDLKFAVDSTGQEADFSEIIGPEASVTNINEKEQYKKYNTVKKLRTV